MKAIISRTSIYDDKRPHEMAKIESLPDGSVEWVINVNSIEDILFLIRDTNSPIVVCMDEETGMLELEIYDDWRE